MKHWWWWPLYIFLCIVYLILAILIGFGLHHVPTLTCEQIGALEGLTVVAWWWTITQTAMWFINRSP